MSLVAERTPFDKGFRKVFFVCPNSGTMYSSLCDKYGGDNVKIASASAAEDAINAAINQCLSGANDAVYLAPGSYTLSATISLKKNITLLGMTDNPNGTILAPGAAIVAITTTADADYAVMKNFTITIGSTATKAIDIIAACPGIRMENVVINGSNYATGQIGVASSSDYTVMKGCRLTGIKNGVQSYGSHCLFVDNYLSSTVAASKGIDLTSGDYSVVSNNDFVLASTAAIPIVLGSSGTLLYPVVSNNRSMVHTTVILATAATSPRYFNNNMTSSATVVLAAVVA